MHSEFGPREPGSCHPGLPRTKRFPNAVAGLLLDPGQSWANGMVGHFAMVMVCVPGQRFFPNASLASLNSPNLWFPHISFLGSFQGSELQGLLRLWSKLGKGGSGRVKKG